MFEIQKIRAEICITSLEIDFLYAIVVVVCWLDKYILIASWEEYFPPLGISASMRNQSYFMLVYNC